MIQLEVEGVQAAEKGDIDKAIDLFGQAILLAPQRASGYNNRAQAFRIKGDAERKSRPFRTLIVVMLYLSPCTKLICTFTDYSPNLPQQT